MISRRSRQRLSLAALLLLLSVLVFVLVRPHAIGDWLRLRGYVPSAEIVALADDTAMSDSGRHLFYINRPALHDKAAFRSNCPDYGEQTIVIGCYNGGQRGIHILEVEDERLQGVEEVTAAHEMLHAAYDRLSKSDRARLDKLLQAYADTGLTSERIKAALKDYQRTEPGQHYNEMHSMFGTEIASLPAELEAHYSRYFIRRAEVVGFAERYQDAFTSRQSALEDYDRQLQKRSQQIKDNTQDLRQREAAIEAARQRLDNLRANGNTEAYNAGVEPYNSQVDAYNALLETTRQLIDQYNALVEERNAIAAQTVELQQAIDSSSLPGSQTQ